VATAAQDALARQQTVTPVDVCVGIGWLSGRHVEAWRQGRAASLRELLPVDDTRLTQFLGCLDDWARASGLEQAETDYVSATRDRRPLCFTAAQDPGTERAWRTRWIPTDLPAAARERVVRRQEKPPDLVVVMPVKDWQCAECDGIGDLLIMDNAGPLCLTCADLDHLVFLAVGDAALTRRAKKASTLSAVVVRWSRTRKRYERQGILTEEAGRRVFAHLLDPVGLSLLGDKTSITIFRYEAGNGRRSSGAQANSATPADRRLMGAAPRFASDGLAVDDLDLAAELFRQVTPDLLGDRLRLKVLRVAQS
jgi:hypothetical protein